MRPIPILFSLIVLFILLACDQQKPQSMGMEVATEEMVAPKTAGTPATGDTPIERQLIKQGRVEFETTDLANTRKAIFAAINTYEAYVSSDEEYTYAGRKSNTLIIRVPAKDFDALLAEATKGVDRFESKQLEVVDVTEEFVDIQARLKTKKELEDRYLDLLKRAKTVSEMLEIEKEMGSLRSEIESIEGRLKYLENKVGYATLTITFYQTVPKDNAFGQKINNGFRNGVDNLVWVFVGLVNIWPFLLLSLVFLIALRRYRKGKKK